MYRKRIALLLGTTARASMMLAFVMTAPTLLDSSLPNAGLKNFSFVDTAHAGWGDSDSDGGDGGDGDSGGDGGDDGGDSDGGDDGGDGGWGGDDGDSGDDGGDDGGDDSGDDGSDDSGDDGGDSGHDGHSKHHQQDDESSCVDTPDEPTPPSRVDHDSKKMHSKYTPCHKATKVLHLYKKWHKNCYWWVYNAKDGIHFVRPVDGGGGTKYIYGN